MKINRREYEDFRATLPEALRNEVFSFLNEPFDVTIARYLIKTLNIVPTDLGVKLWAKEMHLDWPKGAPNTDHWLNGVSDSLALRPSIDVTIPVIVIELAMGQESAPFLIDGHKRLRKAFVDGIDIIKAYYIPKEPAKLTYDCNRSSRHYRR